MSLKVAAVVAIASVVHTSVAPLAQYLTACPPTVECEVQRNEDTVQVVCPRCAPDLSTQVASLRESNIRLWCAVIVSSLLCGCLASLLCYFRSGNLQVGPNTVYAGAIRDFVPSDYSPPRDPRRSPSRSSSSDNSEQLAITDLQDSETRVYLPRRLHGKQPPGSACFS